MCPSLLAFALSGLLAPAVAADEPTWLRDYNTARQQSRSENRPLCVVIGSGETGWNQLSQEGRLTKDIKKLLAANYVCLYIDTDEHSGYRLARAFDVSERPAVIISDSTGRLQAFRHEGYLAHDTIASYLRRYADPEREVLFTETNPGDDGVSRYAPVSPAPPVYYPSFGGRSC